MAAKRLGRVAAGTMHGRSSGWWRAHTSPSVRVRYGRDNRVQRLIVQGPFLPMQSTGRRGTRESDVDALTGQRVDVSGGIADEQHTTADPTRALLE